MLDLHAVTWECVHFVAAGSRAGAVACNTHQGVCELDANGIESEKDLLQAVSKAMQFPDYFGMNWDAMDECLADMEWGNASEGYVLWIRNSAGLWRSDALSAGRLVQSWLQAAQSWSQMNTPFHLVFDDM